MLIPGDLRRVGSPMLRARLTAHLLDEPRDDFSELREIFTSAVQELLDQGFTLEEIAQGTFLELSDLRRRVIGEAPRRLA